MNYRNTEQSQKTTVKDGSPRAKFEFVFSVFSADIIEVLVFTGFLGLLTEVTLGVMNVQ